MAEDAEREDPKRALRDASQKAKPKGVPPHWLRCEWYNDEGQRCRLGDGHHPGTPHKFKEE